VSSINVSISGSIRAFFKGLPQNGTLVLTTFGLDEIVLERLLKEVGVPQNYPIYVFHDIIGHRNPGFLRTSFSRPQIIGVRLPSTKRYRCPVFHSKVWIVLSPDRRVCRLAVHSVNLTRYHLAVPVQTFESFWCRRDLDLPFPRSPLLSVVHKNISKNAVRRIGRSAETWIITESADGLVSFEFSPRSAGEIISKVIANHADKPKRIRELVAAAPFVNVEVLKELHRDTVNISAHTGCLPEKNKSRSIFLHAKVLAAAGAVIGGSANFTRQALRVGCKPVNHETVLVLRRQNRTLHRLLKKFPPIEQSPEDDDIPGDDPELNGEKAWEEARRLADRGPRDVRLELDPRSRLARIRLVGSPDGARVLSICSGSAGHGKQIEALNLHARRGLIRVPRIKQSLLAKIVLPDMPVVVEGRKNAAGKALWRRELDRGELWSDLSAWHKSLMRCQPPTPDRDAQNGPPPPDGSRFVDIRDIRDRILLNEAAPTAWFGWILRYQDHDPYLRDIPDWILKLKEKL